MNKLVFIILFTIALVSFSRAESNIETKILYETKSYTVYCIEDYKWIKWLNAYTPPIQMFKENGNNRSVPVSCK